MQNGTDGDKTVNEAVGVFVNAEQLQGAIDELLSSGFDRASLSLLASEQAVEGKLGHKYQRTSELEDDPNVPRAAYVSTESVGDAEGAVIGALAYIGAGVLMGPVALSGGTLAAIAAAAALGTGIGGSVGAVLASAIGQQHAQRIEDQVRHGGLLLWVRTSDKTQEMRAVEVMARHSGRDVHIHAGA